VLAWTFDGHLYFMYFTGGTRVVVNEPTDEWPEPASSPNEPKHPADPLWFIFVVKEALRLSTADAFEVAPGRLRVQVDLRETLRSDGSVQLAHGPLRRAFSRRYRQWMRGLEGEFVLDHERRIVRSQHFAAPAVLGSSSASAVNIEYPDERDGFRLENPPPRAKVVRSSRFRIRLPGALRELAEAYRFGFQSVRRLRAEERECRGEDKTRRPRDR
jgi:hypothetical protein